MRIILGTMTFGGQIDENTAEAMVEVFLDHGYREIDTASRYTSGKAEEILGRILTYSLREKAFLATKVNPYSNAGLQPKQVIEQLETSLRRLQTDWVDVLYLHAPDNKTPIELTLEACQGLFRQGKFRELGVSNYAAWQVAEIWYICRQNGWVKPTLYQGMYNALTRDVERELLPALKRLGIRFYAYNPLAGGLLTGKYKDHGEAPKDGRFTINREYEGRYWKKTYFMAVKEIREVCELHGISMDEAALRWLQHHSSLKGSRNDGIILGASKIEHLEENLKACEGAKLPEEVAAAYDKGWEIARSDCPCYFRT